MVSLIVALFLEIYRILKYFSQMVLENTMSRSGGNTGFLYELIKTKQICVDHPMIISLFPHQVLC